MKSKYIKEGEPMIVRWANNPSIWKAVLRDSRYCPHISITSEYMGGSIVLYLEDDHAKVRTVTYSRPGLYPQDIAGDVKVEDVLCNSFFVKNIKPRLIHRHGILSAGIQMSDYSKEETE